MAMLVMMFEVFHEPGIVSICQKVKQGVGQTLNVMLSAGGKLSMLA
jgi:hypothetical protein